MKRSEMIDRLAKWLDLSESTVLMNGNDGKAKQLLDQLEAWGMKPPALSEEYQQGILHTYYAGYSLYQWDEDIANDKKVMEFVEKRRALKKMTPKERRAHREAIREQRNNLRNR